MRLDDSAAQRTRWLVQLRGILQHALRVPDVTPRWGVPPVELFVAQAHCDTAVFGVQVDASGLPKSAGRFDE